MKIAAAFDAFDAIVSMCERLGVARLNKFPACWEYQIDDHWWLAVNGHSIEMACSHGPKVPPYAAYLEFNGWTAGLIDQGGGIIVASDIANEDAFIAACDAVREKA